MSWIDLFGIKFFQHKFAVFIKSEPIISIDAEGCQTIVIHLVDFAIMQRDMHHVWYVEI